MCPQLVAKTKYIDTLIKLLLTYLLTYLLSIGEATLIRGINYRLIIRLCM